MDTVNQVTARAAELFKAMNPTARLLAALSAALIVVSLIWLFGRHLEPSEVYLMGGQPFSPAQLRHMESALGQAGLGDYEVEGTRMRVPQGQQAKYMAALAEAGALPADFGEYLQKAVNTSSFMLSGPRQEAQLKVAIQSELQGVINNFHGIERSSVQIAEETSQGFPRTKTVTASVGVQPNGKQKLDERTVSAIRWIVASAWGGLKPESVTVVDWSSSRLFAGPLDGNGPAAGAYADNKKQLELDWEEKIVRLLGIAGAVVTANVELSDDGHAPRQVSVSVAVPQAYFEAVWQEQYGAPAGKRPLKLDPAAFAQLQQSESERIKQAIVPLLVTADSAVDRDSLVAVSTIYAAAAPAAAQPGYQQVALAWLAENWRAVGVGVLILVGLVMLRSAFGAADPTPAVQNESPDGNQQSLVLVTDDEHEPSSTGGAPIPPPHIPAEARRAELAEMIRQDPEAAASVLRTWLGNAS